MSVKTPYRVNPKRFLWVAVAFAVGAALASVAMYRSVKGSVVQAARVLADPADVKLVPMTPAQQPIIQEMCRYFIYDMSEFIGDDPGMRFPESGIYTCRSWDEYFKEPNKPYLVRYKGEIAGFALVKEKGFHPSVDYHMGEFFIIRKFKNRGLGRIVAYQLFDHYPGTWEVTQILSNAAAIAFWTKIIGDYTNGNFTKTQELLVNPIPGEMIVERFSSKKDPSK